MDISKRKAAEASVLAMNDALTQSNIELERFAYIASHDLQEPLRMVASFTQLLSKKYAAELDSTAQEYIRYAVDGAQRMQQLIRDLLAYSRLGRQIIEEKPVDMAALTARVMQSLKLTIDESNADVKCFALPVVRGDAGQLFRLMQNLIANAIKYRSDKPPRISIAMVPGSDDRTFCVRDNGIGISAEHAGRIFEVFQRVQSKVKYPGTGIGLSVCKRVVERHGGRIWFESKPGEGTTFLFSLAADRYSINPVVVPGQHEDVVPAAARRPAARC
jgi:light-regulated signal transduction histidine kinase (bacteriophytochrome)